MNLKEYLRNDWSKNIRHLFIKEACLICGCDTELELHHVTAFDFLVKSTLQELKLNELNTEEYTKEELQSILHYMRSKQINIKYETLCINCHDEKHNKTKPIIKEVRTNKHYLTDEDMAKKVGTSERTIKKWNNKLIELKILEFNNEYDYFLIDDGVLYDCKEEEYKRDTNKYYYRVKKYKTNKDNQLYIDTIELIKSIYGNKDIIVEFPLIE